MKEELKNLLSKYDREVKLLKAMKDNKEKELDVKKSEYLELQNAHQIETNKLKSRVKDLEKAIIDSNKSKNELQEKPKFKGF